MADENTTTTTPTTPAPPLPDPEVPDAAPPAEPKADDTPALTAEDLAARVEARAKELADQQVRSAKAEFDRRMTATADERQELEKLRGEKRQREQAAAEQRGNYDKAIQSVREGYEEEKKAWKTERERLLSRTAQLAVDGAIKTAAGRAINPDHVAQLLRHRLQLDPDTLGVTVLDEHGERAFGTDGNPLKIGDMVDEFLTKNPHMARPASTQRGSGAGGSGGDGHPSGGSTDPGIEAKRRELSDLQSRAAQTHSTADLAAVQRAKRELTKMMTG